MFTLKFTTGIRPTERNMQLARAAQIYYHQGAYSDEKLEDKKPVEQVEQKKPVDQKKPVEAVEKKPVEQVEQKKPVDQKKPVAEQKKPVEQAEQKKPVDQKKPVEAVEKKSEQKKPVAEQKKPVEQVEQKKPVDQKKPVEAVEKKPVEQVEQKKPVDQKKPVAEQKKPVEQAEQKKPVDQKKPVEAVEKKSEQKKPVAEQKKPVEQVEQKKPVDQKKPVEAVEKKPDIEILDRDGNIVAMLPGVPEEAPRAARTTAAFDINNFVKPAEQKASTKNLGQVKNIDEVYSFIRNNAVLRPFDPMPGYSIGEKVAVLKTYANFNGTHPGLDELQINTLIMVFNSPDLSRKFISCGIDPKQVLGVKKFNEVSVKKYDTAGVYDFAFEYTISKKRRLTLLVNSIPTYDEKQGWMNAYSISV